MKSAILLAFLTILYSCNHSERSPVSKFDSLGRVCFRPVDVFGDGYAGDSSLLIPPAAANNRLTHIPVENSQASFVLYWAI